MIRKSEANDLLIPSTNNSLGIVEVLDVTIEAFFLTLSIFLKTSCLISSLSRTTSIIKSASAINSKLSSKLPVSIRFTLSLCIKGVGLPNLTGLSILFTAVSAITLLLLAPLGTISSNVTGKPALAT